ncbi:hypothetical protein IMZ31_20150 (plasmid) [Pontibacillus sp. ALD_SL1]|uniref:hypothetical protein n=1 Tax=Pontibacillus sp. ALD_SL1 TaxID=2777185 RepID=UPI001A958948|nr:hypothetical protein [Pontibacillus sp. ALD_SL1]QST02864.1 hypothetical protein IMZ31_20150 [Pontibacillus sp. ALD_SL1]
MNNGIQAYFDTTAKVEVLREWNERIENGTLSGKEKGEAHKVYRELVGISADLRESEEWKQYMKVIHDIEQSEFSTISESCSLAKELVSSIKGCPAFDLISDIRRVKDWYAVLYKGKKRVMKETKEKSISSEEFSCVETFQTFQEKMSTLLLEMDTTVQNLYEDIQGELDACKHQFYDTNEELAWVEQHLCEQPCNAVTTYYAISYYRELRQRRRAIKTKRHLLKRINHYEYKGSNDSLRDELQKFSKFTSFQISNQKKNEHKIFQPPTKKPKTLPSKNNQDYNNRKIAQ